MPALAPKPTPRRVPPIVKRPKPPGTLRPPTGAVIGIATSVKSGSTCTANVNGTMRTVLCPRDLTIAIGDVLLIHRVLSSWVCTVRLYSAATTGEPPMLLPELDPVAGSITGSLTVLPIYTSSYRNSGWRADEHRVDQGDWYNWGNEVGAAFYGTKPQSLAGATVTSARLETLHRHAGPGGPTGCTLWLLTESTRPSGAPTRTLSTAGPTTSAGDIVSFTIPTAWAQAIVNGTSGGIGIYTASGTPAVGFSGRAIRAAAWTLVIDWTR